MKAVKKSTLERNLTEGKWELCSEIFGSTTQYAEIRNTETGKKSTIELK